MLSAQPEFTATAAGARTGRGSLFWSLYAWIHVLSWLFVGAVCAVVAGGAARLFGDTYGKVAHACVAFAYRTMVRLHPRYRFTLTGAENLPQGAAILCPNHQSLSDVVYLFSLPLAFRWVIKKELFAIPLFGAAMRLARYPQVDRGNPDSAIRLIHEVQTLLEAGIPVVSFPEGTRSHTGKLGRFHNGPARIAVLSQVPLVPVGVIGTDHLLPRGSFAYPARAHIAIHIGPPLAVAGTTLRDVRRLTHELRAGVEAAKIVALRAVDAGTVVR